LYFVFGHISVINEDMFVKFDHTRVTVAEYPTFGKIQGGGGGHLKFFIFGHISVVNKLNELFSSNLVH